MPAPISLSPPARLCSSATVILAQRQHLLWIMDQEAASQWTFQISVLIQSFKKERNFNTPLPPPPAITIFFPKVDQNRASGDQAHHSFLTAAFWWPSCGDTLCSTRRPERVSEIPTHHSVIWASPKISCPRKACGAKRERDAFQKPPFSRSPPDSPVGHLRKI